MTLEEQLALSFYREVADIDRDHRVALVQHTETKRFYVKKELLYFNHALFTALMERPVEGVPRIHLAVRDGDVLIVIEEYIFGESLREILEGAPPVSPEFERPFTREDAIRTFFRILDIVERLHSQDPPIIHRDLTPSNILLTPRGEVFVLDLNAARFDTGEARPEDTVLLGTKGYAAPEQFGFGTSDQRSDIYALGMLLGTMLCGHFDPSCRIPGKVGDCVRTCIQMDPRDRYRSVRALRMALERAEGLPHARSTGERSLLLPPGFRTGNPIHMAVALTGYTFFLLSVISLQYKTPAETLLMRVFWVIACTAVILFTCNYRNIQRFLPPVCRRNRILHVLGVLLTDLLAVLVPFLFTILIDMWLLAV